MKYLVLPHCRLAVGVWSSYADALWGWTVEHDGNAVVPVTGGNCQESLSQ